MGQIFVYSNYTGADHVAQVEICGDPKFRGELQSGDQVLFAKKDGDNIGKLVCRAGKAVYTKGSEATISLLREKAAQLGYLQITTN